MRVRCPLPPLPLLRLGLALSAGILCAATPAFPNAQEPVATTETLHVRTQLVLVDASVTRRKTGEVLTGLTPEDFVLTEDGVPQTLTSLSQNTLPLSLVFLFDTTDTVRPVLYPLALGARRVLSHLRPEDEVAVMTVSTHATLLQKFTQSHADIVFALGDASSVYDRDQATFVYEDLYEATEQALQSRVPNSRRVEVWLTDGTANYEDAAMRAQHGKGAPAVLHSEAEAAALLGRSEVAVSALIEQSELTSAQLAGNRANTRTGDIEHFADLTGGPVVHTSSPQIVDRFAALLDTLRERYTLGYKPAQPKPAGTVCSLALTLSPAFFTRHPELRARDIVIRTRQSYVR